MKGDHPDVMANSNNIYLNGGGEMGELIRTYNWSNNVLGRPETWPQSLLMTVGTLLKSRFPMFIWWGTDLIQFYNDAYRPSLGSEGKHPNALGQKGVDCWPEVWPVIYPLIEQVMSGGEATWSEDQLIPIFRNNKMEDVYWTFSYSPIIDESGKPGGVLAVVTETTNKVILNELRAAKQELQLAEESLRYAVEASNIGTWYIDPDTKELKCSERFKALWGFDFGEHVTLEHLFELIPPSHQQYVKLALEKAISEQGDYYIEHPLTRKDNRKTIWLRALGSLNRSAFSRNSYFSGVAMDITEQKLEDQRKNDFIGMVSHELKTPLTSLNAYLQMLQSKAKQTEDIFTLGALDQSVKQVKRMTTMINGFLNVSRLESAKIHIDKQNFDMADLIKETEAETIAMYATHRIIFHPVEPTLVCADRDKIGQVINNFISNAVKYSKPDTDIQVSCVTIDGFAQVSVNDQGLGIRQEEIERLFERYYRVENNNLVSGFGIGLYLSAEIINRHDGKIWAKSELGKGSTFYFSLPVITL